MTHWRKVDNQGGRSQKEMKRIRQSTGGLALSPPPAITLSLKTPPTLFSLWNKEVEEKRKWQKIEKEHM